MHNHRVSGGRFLAVTILNVAITIVEIIGGLLSGSLALLSDAFHNLGDSLSIVLGYFAQSIAGRPENHRRTYGYRRAGIVNPPLQWLWCGNSSRHAKRPLFNRGVRLFNH